MLHLLLQLLLLQHSRTATTNNINSRNNNIHIYVCTVYINSITSCNCYTQFHAFGKLHMCDCFTSWICCCCATAAAYVFLLSLSVCISFVFHHDLKKRQFINVYLCYNARLCEPQTVLKNGFQIEIKRMPKHRIDGCVNAHNCANGLLLGVSLTLPMMEWERLCSSASIVKNAIKL